MLSTILVEIVKAGLTAGLTLLSCWLQKRKDLRDLESGKKTIQDLKK